MKSTNDSKTFVEMIRIQKFNILNNLMMKQVRVKFSTLLAVFWIIILPINAQNLNENHFAPELNHCFLADDIKPSLHFVNGNVVKWQQKSRKQLRLLLGDLPKEKVSLNVRSIWKKEDKFGSIEKIVFTSEPYADVPAYVCLPKNIKPPYTFVLCLQGHSTGMHNSICYNYDESEKAKIPGDRDFAIQCMKRGLAAICIEQRGFGQRKNSEDIEKNERNSCEAVTMRALLIGRTIQGERIYDIDRAIDYLETRKDFNKKTLGITGNSTGGSISLYAAAVLPRIKWAMPSCGFVKFRNTQMKIPCCVCSFIPDIYKYFDESDVAGLIAPRPLMFVTASNDRLQPIEATMDAFKHVKKIYNTAGVKNNCKIIVGDEGHRFYADLAFPELFKMIEKPTISKEEKVITN